MVNHRNHLMLPHSSKGHSQKPKPKQEEDFDFFQYGVMITIQTLRTFRLRNKKLLEHMIAVDTFWGVWG